MKTIILTAIIAFTVLSTEAKPLIIDYVLTDDGVRYFERVKYGVNENYMIGITEAGEKVKFSKEDITSYRKNGDVYKKTKLIGNSIDFNDCVFMKLLQTRHGFSLYCMIVSIQWVMPFKDALFIKAINWFWKLIAITIYKSSISLSKNTNNFLIIAQTLKRLSKKVHSCAFAPKSPKGGLLKARWL
jgi:hypothetical protein